MVAHLFAGFLSSLVLIVAIGAQNSFVLRQGIRGEHLLPVTLLCVFSDLLLIGAGIAGLGALIQTLPQMLAAARYGGAAFLFVYGCLAARRAWHGEHLAVQADGPRSLGKVVATCLGFTFLNPHVYLDTVILLGALANQHGDGGRWVFGAGAGVASLLWFFALAYGARRLAPVFIKPLAWRVLDALIALLTLGLAYGLLAGEGGAAMGGLTGG